MEEVVKKSRINCALVRANAKASMLKNIENSAFRDDLESREEKITEIIGDICGNCLSGRAHIDGNGNPDKCMFNLIQEMTSVKETTII